MILLLQVQTRSGLYILCCLFSGAATRKVGVCFLTENLRQRCVQPFQNRNGVQQRIKLFCVRFTYLFNLPAPICAIEVRRLTSHDLCAQEVSRLRIRQTGIAVNGIFDLILILTQVKVLNHLRKGASNGRVSRNRQRLHSCKAFFFFRTRNIFIGGHIDD